MLIDKPRHSNMDKIDDIQLNLTCSHKQSSNAIKLPQRMPDGRNIYTDPKLKTKILKTHAPAFGNSEVFIPKHKLPVLDEFGFLESKPKPSPSIGKSSNASNNKIGPQTTLKNNHNNSKYTTVDKHVLNAEDTKLQTKRRPRKKKDTEIKIIPKEVRDLAGGLPPSFPKYRIKKFTEEYQRKRNNEDEQASDEPLKKRRNTFKAGPNPRKTEKASNLFVDMTLSDLEDLHPYLVSNLKDNFGIEHLTKIQSMAMPLLLKTRLSLNEREFIINSGVGSGKIISYVAPIVNNLVLIEPQIKRDDGIFALVLLPTRELAAEVNEVFVRLCRSFTRIVPGLLTGGERKKSEKARLRKGLNILITTPGRLIDHIEHSLNLDFRKLRYCILGDAHRLLDPIREETSKKIAIVLRKKLPHDCVKCVATSTLTTKLKKFLSIFIHNPVTIDGFKDFDDNDDRE